MRKLFFIYCFLSGFLFSINKVDAQNLMPVGEWQSHFNYLSGVEVEEADNKVFFASENGFFYLDKEDNSYRYLSTNSGLSDFKITSMVALPDNSGVIIGYDNANLDILQENTISNYSRLKDEINREDKRIYHLLPVNNLLYISTGFGVVVLNLDNFLIEENYFNVGPEGSRIQAFGATVFRDSVWLATQKGILAASLDPSVNRQDFTNWYLFTIQDGIISNTPFVDIATFNNRIYTVASNGDIYEYDQFWSPSTFTVPEPVQNISVSGNALFMGYDGGFGTFDGTNFSTNTNGFFDVSDVSSIGNKTWVADNEAGLIEIDAQTLYRSPESLPLTTPFNLVYSEGTMHALAGGFSRNGTSFSILTGLSRYEDRIWSTFSENPLPQFIPVDQSADWVDAEVIGDLTIVASFQSGLHIIDIDNNSSTLDAGSPGTSLQYSQEEPLKTKISALAKDGNGQIWLANFDSSVPLHKWDGREEWQGFNLITSGSRYLIDVRTSPFNNVWLKLSDRSGGGLLAFDPENLVERRVSTQDDNGALPSNFITDYQFDLDGILWITTDEGVVYLDDPTRALAQNSDGLFFAVEAIIPVFEGQFLFRNTRVNCIAIDGGNRKWMGTENGAWLFDEDINELVDHYTTENSPLPDNNVIDIEVNNQSGEVFISTEKGVVSFQSDAIEEEDNLDELKIYPNPVRPGYTGLITIDGLIRDALIKITDISGNLVYETYSNGGRATWNGKTANGQQVGNGIYLVLVATNDGSQKIAGKIAIVN